MMLEGAAEGAAFEIYVEQILAPSLTAGQIVVMDNLSIHKGARVRACHRSARLSAALFAQLFAGSVSHRGSLFQTESLSAESRSENTRGVTRSRDPGLGHHHRSGRPRLVSALWLSAY